MRRTRSFVVPCLALAAALVYAACSNSTSSSACGSGTAPSVPGTYKLASYTFGSTTVDTLGGATGQLRFHASTYAFNATLPVVGGVSDSGTYAISGVRCMSETSVVGQGSSSGTFTLSGTTTGSVFTFTGTNSQVGGVGFVAVRQ